MHTQCNSSLLLFHRHSQNIKIVHPAAEAHTPATGTNAAAAAVWGAAAAAALQPSAHLGLLAAYLAPEIDVFSCTNLPQHDLRGTCALIELPLPELPNRNCRPR